MNEKVKLLAIFFEVIDRVNYPDDKKLAELVDYWREVFSSEDATTNEEAVVMANEAVINRVLFDK